MQVENQPIENMPSGVEIVDNMSLSIDDPVDVDIQLDDQNNNEMEYSSDQQQQEEKKANLMPYSIPGQGMGEEKSTLNEAVSATLMRDLTNIWLRTKLVFTRSSEEERLDAMRNYDLWGPFLYFVLFALICSLHRSDNDESRSDVFQTILQVVTIGSMVLTVNGKLISSNIGLLQTLSILGYSFTPTLGAAIFILLITFSKILDFIIACQACYWSIRVSAKLVSCRTENSKKVLVTIPVILYQIMLTWMMLRVL